MRYQHTNTSHNRSSGFSSVAEIAGRMRSASCASAWRSWKGCWKDCARPLPDGSRPAKGRTWAHLYLNKLSKELEWTPELPEKHR